MQGKSSKTEKVSTVVTEDKASTSRPQSPPFALGPPTDIAMTDISPRNNGKESTKLSDVTNLKKHEESARLSPSPGSGSLK